MKLRIGMLTLVFTLIAATVTPSFADEVIIVDEHGTPAYNSWQAAWDRYEFDRHHVILGTVVRFEPFRLQVARRDGNVQMIDLKPGTVIKPTGATPMQNERVAVVGYYSNGTFIANRVLIRA
jgi:hypothetical protein